jgi:hypothetical protein
VASQISIEEFVDRFVYELSLLSDGGRNFDLGCPVNDPGRFVMIRVRCKTSFGIPSYVDTTIKKTGNMINVGVIHYDYLGVSRVLLQLSRIGFVGSALAVLGSCLVPVFAIPTWIVGGGVFLMSASVMKHTSEMPFGHREESLSLKVQCTTCLRRATYGLDPGAVTWSMTGDGISGGF